MDLFGVCGLIYDLNDGRLCFAAREALFLCTGATDSMVRVQLGGSLAVAPCRESTATHQAIVAGGAGTLIGFMLPRLGFDTSRFGLVIWLVSDGKVKVLVGDSQSPRKDRFCRSNSCLSQFG